MPINDKAFDDLTLIPGLGEKAQEWLVDRFNVHTFADLAALTAKDLYAQAQADSKRFNLKTIQPWPQKAAELSAKLNSTTTDIPNNSTSASVPLKDSGSKRLPLSAAVESEGRWEHVAHFIVEIVERQIDDQEIEHATIVHHHEADKSINLPGIQTEKIGNWILGQVAPKLRLGITDRSFALEPGSKLGLRRLVNLKQIYIYQPAGTLAPMAASANGAPSFIIIHAGAPFSIEALIDYQGHAGAPPDIPEVPFKVQFFGQDRSDGSKFYLGDSQMNEFSGEKTHFNPSISGIMLPVGLYRLHALVVTKPEEESLGFLEVPLIKVI